LALANCRAPQPLIDADRRTALAWLTARRPAMLVQVLSARGSVPRGAGTRMLVAADSVAGTIGGGHLALQAIERARAMLVGGGAASRAASAADGRADTRLTTEDRNIALGPTLGQCCGGALTLRTGPLDAAALADWPDPAPLFDLQLYGAGHVGRAIVHLLDSLPCKVQWTDEREAESPAIPSAPHITRRCVDAVEAEVQQALPAAFYLVLTHSHALDLRITEAVLRRGDFGFFGLIGSASQRARFGARLAQRGVAAEAIARPTCPIGVAGIPGKQPEQIAMTAVAQLLQVAASRRAT
jgi:xanthine dehydrogenase accessory factor